MDAKPFDFFWIDYPSKRDGGPWVGRCKISDGKWRYYVVRILDGDPLQVTLQKYAGGGSFGDSHTLTIDRQGRFRSCSCLGHQYHLTRGTDDCIHSKAARKFFEVIYPQHEKAMNPSTKQNPLWPIPIPVICVAGEVGSGKTLFGLTITRPEDTLVWDEEGSSASYHRSLPFTRISITDECQKAMPKGFRPVDVFSWWKQSLLAIPKGKYRVGVLDTISLVDSGLTDYVQANPDRYGHTAAQYQSMSGLMWGDVDEEWRTIISECEARFETFVFAAHMGEEFKDKKPSNRRRPKFKKVFLQKASLILQLERAISPDGKRSDKPSATVLKDRLSVVSHDEATGEFKVRSVLPPRLAVCTPKTIRDYCIAPADPENLRADQLAPIPVLSEDERLQLKLRIAEAELEAKRPEGPPPAAKSESTSQAGDLHRQNGKSKNVDPVFVRVEALKEAYTLMVGLSPVAVTNRLKALYGHETVDKLNDEQLSELLRNLRAKAKETAAK